MTDEDELRRLLDDAARRLRAKPAPEPEPAPSPPEDRVARKHFIEMVNEAMKRLRDGR
jgi:hypothetical protein